MTTSFLRRRAVRALAEFAWLACAVIIGAPQTARAADIPSGTLIVLDAIGGTQARGQLYAVSPPLLLGPWTRQVVSDFGNAQQGPLGTNPVSVAVLPAWGNTGRRLLVIDDAVGTDNRGALFRVDPATGQRTILSDFGNPNQGPLGTGPSGVTVVPGILEPEIYVVDPNYYTTDPINGPFNGAVFRVNPSTGVRTVVSDFNNTAQGDTPIGEVTYLTGISSDPTSGTLYVTDVHGGTAGRGRLYSVNKTNGQRTWLQDFGNSSQGPLGSNPHATSFAPGLLGLLPSVFVVDDAVGTGAQGALFSAPTSAGAQRAIVSDFGNGAQGQTGTGPTAVLVGTGLLGLLPPVYVLDPDAGATGQGMLFQVDMLTGNRSVISNFGDGGPVGPAPGSFTYLTGLAIIQ